MSGVPKSKILSDLVSLENIVLFPVGSGEGGHLLGRVGMDIWGI